MPSKQDYDNDKHDNFALKRNMNKKIDDKKFEQALLDIFTHYQEKLKNNSDRGKEEISNQKAKRILGSGCLLPSHIQGRVIFVLEYLELAKRESQETIKLLPNYH